MSVSTARTVDVRCPVGMPGPDGTCRPGKLLLKLRQAGGQPQYVHPDNLIELPCDDCRKRLRKSGREVRRVLHRYNFIGELIETLVRELPAGRRKRTVSISLRDIYRQAACTGMTELFYGPSDSAQASVESPAEKARIAAARKICRTCPVLAACGEYAIWAHEDWGVWGGMARGPRVRLRMRLVSARQEREIAGRQ